MAQKIDDMIEQAVHTGTERVKTGIPGLDGLVQGGFRKGGIITVTGDSGCGKTTFGIQFLYMGATQYDEPGLYVTFEEEKGAVCESMKGYGWDLKKLESEGKLIFLEYQPQEVERFTTEEAFIRDEMEEKGVKRMVVDSMTSLALLYDTEKRRRQELLRIIGKLRKWNCTTLLLSESAPEMSTPDSLRTRFGIEALADGLIYLYNIRKGNTRIRALEVIKLRGTAFEQKICPVRFRPNGIVVYPSEQVYEG